MRRIDADARTIVLGDSERVVHYDRLVLAAGSVMRRSAIPGAEHGFTVGIYDDALALQRHLSALPLQHDRAGRFTAVEHVFSQVNPDKLERDWRETPIRD